MMSKKESGFTLIEIVMVLVLLGILMAVAAPKYFDMQDKAREQAENAIAAEVQARINGEFAQRLLAGESCTVARSGAITAVTDANQSKLEDRDEWTATVNHSETGTSVTINWLPSGPTSTKTLVMPECGAYTTNNTTP